MQSQFKCPRCGKTDTYVMQDDVVVKTRPDGEQVWLLYCHFCGADMGDGTLPPAEDSHPVK